MSTKENDVYLEDMRIKFEDAVAEKNWDEIQPIYIELEEKGFGDKVVELSNTLTEEEKREYMAWDRKVNGSIETQMDDDSADQGPEGINPASEVGQN